MGIHGRRFVIHHGPCHLIQRISPDIYQTAAGRIAAHCCGSLTPRVFLGLVFLLSSVLGPAYTRNTARITPRPHS